MKRLAEKKGTDVSSFEVKSLMGEYDFVAKQLYQMKDVSKMALELAELYRKDEQMIYAQDAQYGEGRAPVLQRRSVYFTRRKYQENRGFL